MVGGPAGGRCLFALMIKEMLSIKIHVHVGVFVYIRLSLATKKRSHFSGRKYYFVK